MPHAPPGKPEHLETARAGFGGGRRYCADPLWADPLWADPDPGRGTWSVGAPIGGDVPRGAPGCVVVTFGQTRTRRGVSQSDAEALRGVVGLRRPRRSNEL